MNKVSFAFSTRSEVQISNINNDFISFLISNNLKNKAFFHIRYKCLRAFQLLYNKTDQINTCQEDLRYYQPNTTYYSELQSFQ